MIRRFCEEVIGQGLPGQPPGREGIKFFVQAFRAGFPDIGPKSLDPLLADGDLEAGRSVITGTHQGEFMGVPATGKTVEIESVDIIRIVDGKVAEHWGVTDAMGLMEQLGAIPS